MKFTTTRPATPVERALDEAVAGLRRGDPAAARAAARRAAELDPARLDALWLWGSAAGALWSFPEAEQVFAQGARLAPEGPRRISFLAQHARSLASLGRNAEAVSVANQALNAGAADGSNLNLLGAVLQQAGLMPQAVEVLTRAVADEPGLADAWYNLGTAQQYCGDIDNAEKSYEQAIALAGPDTPAHLSLAGLRRWTREKNHIGRLISAPLASSADAARFGYALFKELDDIGDTARAWDVLQQAAQAARDQMVPPEAGPDGAVSAPPSRIGAWKAEDDRRMVDAWIEHLPASRFAGLAPRPHDGPRRIFIIGLPRSGTTLIERILTAHSGVQAQGELPNFPVAVKARTGALSGPLIDPDAATVAAAARLDPAVLAEDYVRETAILSDGSAYAIDKLPHNHTYAGLIRLAFPDALLVHVRRNPMDSLFGAYKQLFAYAYRWSYTQDDLAAHYGHYRRLMAHWQSCFPLIEVSLEAVIANPDAEIRRLLDACGLPFEPACLTPHRTAGAVATASSVQVRSPINDSGVGAWRRYAGQLEPLKQRLTAMGFIDEQGYGL